MEHNPSLPSPTDPVDPNMDPTSTPNPSSPPPTDLIDASTAPPSAPEAMLLQQQVRSIRRVLLLAGVAVLVLLLLGGLWGYLWHQGYYFYSTDDATVSATMANAAPKATGAITQVNRVVGDHVLKGEVIAVLQKDDGSTENVTAPLDGTIVQEGATPGEVLQGGEMLAQVVDLHTVFITAYVEDDHIKDVHRGEGVDVSVDSVSGETFHGTVTDILPVTAATLGALPTTDYASGNFTKVTQRVPVQVTLDGDTGQSLYPGVPTNVTIHLHT
jgi:multidrug resistance efflux pump